MHTYYICSFSGWNPFKVHMTACWPRLELADVVDRSPFSAIRCEPWMPAMKRRALSPRAAAFPFVGALEPAGLAPRALSGPRSEWRACLRERLRAGGSSEHSVGVNMSYPAVGRS